MQQINLGCTRDFSYDSPVRLEFSHDGGVTWDLLVRSCYPSGQHLETSDQSNVGDQRSHLCTGSARTLDESSRYHQGDYDLWTRVTVGITKIVASKLVVIIVFIPKLLKTFSKANLNANLKAALMESILLKLA